MSRWKIYRLVNGAATEVAECETLEYHGTWMGECFVNVSVRSAVPINFKIGDYLTYRGEKFVLAIDPSVIKKSSRNTYGEGFVYSDIKMSSLSTELTDIRFLDYVLGDNELHYTSLPDFPFFAATVDDYADRLQANTNRWCEENGLALEDYWLFLTPSYDVISGQNVPTRFIERASMLRKDAQGNWEGLTSVQATNIWNAAYASGIDADGAKTDVNIQVSGQSIWEALTTIKNEFKLNFINRGRQVIIGAAGVSTEHLFQYGKDNGLYEIERHADSDQQIVTKLYAYGSQKNLPVRYYNNVRILRYVIANGLKSIVHGSSVRGIYVQTDLPFSTKYFNDKITGAVRVYKARVKCNDYPVNVEVEEYDERCRIRCEYGVTESDLTAVLNFNNHIERGDRVYFIKGIDNTEWPKNHTEYTNAMPIPYGKVTSLPTYATGSDPYIQMVLDVDYDADDFYNRSSASSVEYPYFVGLLKVDNYIVKCQISYQGGKVLLSSQYSSSATPLDIFETDASLLNNFMSEVSVGTEVEIISGADYLKFPKLHNNAVAPVLPNNMAVNRLMLPGFPNKSLYAWITDINGGHGTAVEDSANDDSKGRATITIGGVTYDAFFSKELYRPFILSPNFKELGTLEASKTFDGSDDTEEIFPTIEGTGYDIIQHAEVINDNGMYDDAEPDEFQLKIPSFADIEELIEEGTQEGGTPTITMKDGYCASYDFEIDKDSVSVQDGVCVLKCKRYYNDLIQLYFPYSYNVSIGQPSTDDECYQVRGADVQGYGGDHFIITGITMPSEYIDAASVKLLEASLKFLVNNDYTRYTYIPKIDELFMARESDAAIANHSTPLHDTLKEGGLLYFEDEVDLQIPSSNIFIDTLTIKENGNADIPTYEVTLRDDKTVGTMQRIQNEIDSINNAINSGVQQAQGHGGSGMSDAQIRAIVKDYCDERYISRLFEDVASGKITFQEGLESIASAIFGGYVYLQQGFETDGNVKSKDFETGVRGWKIDKFGIAEFQNIKAAVLEVVELLINRLQAQEGDTLYSDNDQIIDVEERVVGNETSYILTLKEKWEGYFTAQMYGNIVKGIINTLAAKDAGVSDETGNNPDKQGSDDGGNKYYTSWMRVVGTHNTNPSLLDLNQIEVVMYGDDYIDPTTQEVVHIIPAGKNFPPCKMMTIARWGCFLDPNEEGITESEKQSRIRRQRLFMLSTSDGRVVKYTEVNKPILEKWNYGVTIGELPDFVKNYADVHKILFGYTDQYGIWHDGIGEHTDWLYAQGIVVQNFVQVSRDGAPKNHYEDCHEWVDGSQIQNPTPRHGIYFVYEFNEEWGQYETHDVWHQGHKWRCLQHQPVVVNGVATYYEPKWNSLYWKMIEGDDNFWIEFSSSAGYSFRRGYVNTIITPYLLYGGVDISSDVATSNWNWTRKSENGKTEADRNWDAEHTGARTQQKALHLTDNDMPASWSSSNKAIFTCTITFTLNNETVTVSNQIIA